MTFEVDRQEMGSLRQMGRTGRTEGEGASRTWGTLKGPEVLQVNKGVRMKGPFELSYKRPVQDGEIRLTRQAVIREKSRQLCKLVFTP